MYFGGPVEPLDMRPDGPGTAEIVKAFSDEDKAKSLPEAYLESAMGDVVQMEIGHRFDD